MMVADSSFQGPSKYVSAFDEPYATHYLVHVLQSKQQVHVEDLLSLKQIFIALFNRVDN